MKTNCQDLVDAGSRIIGNRRNGKLCESPEARTIHGRNSISSGSFLGDTADYSAAYS